MGAYQFLENRRVNASGILHGLFQRTRELCQGRKNVLFVQDSTSVQTKHSDLYEQTKEAGGANGFIVHSALAVDGDSAEVLGSIDQFYWLRD